MEAPLIADRKTPREIVELAALPVADTEDVSDDLSITGDLHGRRFARGEDVDPGWPRWNTLPTSPLGVVVAVRDEDLDARLGELAQTHEEAALGPGAPLDPVVEVAGENDEQDPPGYRALDDGVERFERSVLKLSSKGGISSLQAGERRVQVKIGGVDEAEVHIRRVS